MVKDGEAWRAAVRGVRVENHLVTEQQDFKIWIAGSGYSVNTRKKMLPVMLYSSPKIAIIINTKEKLYMCIYFLMSA